MSKHYQDYKEKAHKELDIVFELLQKTYQVSKDPKVLVSALHHLKDAQWACIDFVMYLENKKSNLESFIELIKNNNSLSEEQLQTIIEVQQLCQEQKDSDVEFRRKDSYVLCNNSYELSMLTHEILYKYFEKTITITKKILR